MISRRAVPLHQPVWGSLRQGLCFCTCTHGITSGVNDYSRSGDHGILTHTKKSAGWVGLELAVNAGTKLKRGYIGSYCINRAPLEWHDRDRPDCPLIGSLAMWALWGEAPAFVKC